VAVRGRTQRTAQMATPSLVVLPRLKVGPRDDAVERQADRMAEQALAPRAAAFAGPAAAPAGPPAGLPVQPHGRGPMARVLHALRGGRPLPARERADMEARFGTRFDGVRIHTEAPAAAAADELNAHAFAVGEHLAFADGAYRPESNTGRRLLAHELAHVVQSRAAQGAAEPALRRDADDERGFFAGLFDAAGEFLAERGWSMVRRFAPRLEPILRRGPVNWLRDQLAGAFDGVVGTLNRLDPAGALDGLAAVFGGLVERAGGIVAALASGDCQPLFDAVGQLRGFVTEVAGAAWERLTAFLQPVGDFFSRLWSGYGAPAAQWLQDLAGDLWSGIQQLGRDIWDWTQPVRDAAASAWDWVKRQLFGPEEDRGEGDDAGGLVGWVVRKATEAWEWVKEHTRPVWQPVADAAARVAELIPPPFLHELGTQMQQLSGELQQTAGEMEEGAGGRPVAENREALAAALPSVQQVIARVREVLVGAGQWLLDRLAALGSGVGTLLGRLRASSLLSALAGALGWLESAAQRLLAWASDGVLALFNRLVQGFDSLTPFFERVLATVRQVIDVMGDLLRLPQLVLGAVWRLIPECIREPVKNFLVQQILGRIPVFGQLFTNPDLWTRVQQTALEILRQAFVDGDLPRAAWTFFQAMLRILGLPPELVVRILAKAAQAIGDVLADPIGFLVNLLRAMRAGFGLFFDNVGTHLLNGVAGWLFGHLSAAGIRPPADFSLRSVLGFVLEVLGITVDNVFRRLAQRVGEGVVQRLRRMLDVATGVWSFVAVLVTEGPAGLWAQIQDRLANLWDSVVEGVIGWITDRVITRASQWLLSLLDVTGIMPVINTLVAVYRAIESFVQYLREILEMVSRVLDGVLGIARGQLDEAAGFLERAMADSLPVAIGFLANQFGLGNIAERMQELIAPVRERVDGAIDWLIERALRLGQALLDMARRGVAAVRGAAGRLRDWWRERFGFRGADGQSHQLYFRGEGANAEVIIESEPKSFPQFIAGIAETNTNRTQRRQAQDLYDQLRRVQREAPPGSEPDRSAEIVDLANRLGQACAALMGPGGDESSEPPRYAALTDGFGTEVEVSRLTHRHVPGDEPSLGGGRWDHLNRRRHGGGSYYILGHLLNHHLGGPGNTWANITPLTRSANSQMSSSFEETVKRAVNTEQRPVYFKVRAHFDGQPVRADLVSGLRSADNPNDDERAIADVIEAEQSVPTRVTGEAREIPAGAAPGTPPSRSGPEIARLDVRNQIETDPSEYVVGDAARTTVYLSSAPLEQLRQLPRVDDELARRIQERASRVGPFRTSAQFLRETLTPPDVWAGFARSSRFSVRLYRRT